MRLKLINNRGLDQLGWSDSLFDSFFEGDSPESWFNETGDEYKLTLNLAGFKKKEIKMSAEGGVLNVEAEQGDRKFHRSFSIPEKADASLLSAKYEDGLLKIVINKKEEEKPIDIKVG